MYMNSLHLDAIEHMNWLEYQHVLPDGRICIRLRTGRGAFANVTLHIADKYGPSRPETRAEAVRMKLAWKDTLFDYYQAILRWRDPRVSYYFTLEWDGRLFYYDQDGILTPEAYENRKGKLACFSLFYAYPAEPKPDWARGAVGYQIFPDRFRREGAPDDGVEPWGSDNVQNSFRFGGNLAGIRAAAPYLSSLGVDLVYMTPIFLSDTSHRYNTFDYYRIDPLLGTEEDLRALTQTLHDHGIRILLDGVFNHSGTAFAPFRDAMEKGKDSPYYDWFFFDGNGGYQHFGGDGGMPKLNLRNEAAQQYFMDVGRYWIEACGIDGWRLDVSTEVWPDFWRVFRKAVRSVNADALLVAECWDDARHCVTVGDMFDSTMHYVLSRSIWDFFAHKTLSLSQFDARVNRAMMMYPHAVQEVLWNFLGSHDTKRFATRCGERMDAFRAGVFFQMTHPGVPVVYYGDELGMTGEDDPYCRHSMVWDQVEGNALLAYYQRLIALRHQLEALRHGGFCTHYIDEETGLYAYLRKTDGDVALCVLCTADAAGEALLPLPEDMRGATKLMECVEEKAYKVEAAHVRIRMAPGKGFVFIGSEAEVSNPNA